MGIGGFGSYGGDDSDWVFDRYDEEQDCTIYKEKVYWSCKKCNVGVPEGIYYCNDCQ